MFWKTQGSHMDGFCSEELLHNLVSEGWVGEGGTDY